MEQNTAIVESIKHLHIIHIFIGHKAQLTNIGMAKAVVALNPQLFEQMNFQTEKDYFKFTTYTLIEMFWLSMKR